MCGLAWLSLRCGGRTGPAPPERCAPDAQDQLLVVCRRSSCTRSSCATPSAPRTTSPRVATASPRSNGSSSRQPARPSPLPTPRSTSQASLAPATSQRRPLWPMPASWRLSTSSRRERVASLARRVPHDMRLAGVVAVSTRKSRGWAWGRRAMCVLAPVSLYTAVVDVPRLAPDPVAADTCRLCAVVRVYSVSVRCSDL